MWWNGWKACGGGDSANTRMCNSGYVGLTAFLVLSGAASVTLIGELIQDLVTSVSGSVSGKGFEADLLVVTPFVFVGWPSFLGVACPAAATMFLAALSGKYVKLAATLVAALSFGYEEFAGVGWPFLSIVASPVLMWAAFSSWMLAGCDAAETESSGAVTESSGAMLLGNGGLSTSVGCDAAETVQRCGDGVLWCAAPGKRRALVEFCCWWCWCQFDCGWCFVGCIRGRG